MIWSTEDLKLALKIDINSNICGEQVQFNSTSVEKGDLFIALKGNKDGHDYSKDALNRGASAVIISHKIEGIEADKAILVPDTLVALKQMAEYKRTKSKAIFIGVTGSSGKTSTKEALKIILSSFGKTFASRENFNNNLGVPINLASQPDDIEYAVFEMGMNASGEIRELTKMVKPDISIITTISAAHLEFFKSVSDIADAKCEIFESMPKAGTAIINIDNQYYPRVLQNIKKSSINNIITFGKSKDADSQLALYEQTGDEAHLKYSLQGNILYITIPFIPEHNAINYAAALAVASVLKLDIKQVDLSKISLTEGRGKIVGAEYNGLNFRIICDYYNANPESLKASLSCLKQLSAKKKVAIIGDMLELGVDSPELHKSLVPSIIESGASKVFLVGNNVKHIYELLPNEIEKKHFINVDLLIEELGELLGSDELILIKGSRGIKLNKIIQKFKVL
ncbi:MAG: UDP-N-acetylmuramoyl-tripeptide--D-alanyl-D-alanine ligase [Candidatus Rickettsia vulgarisii]